MILLLDTETTGLDDSAVCIEVAVALYSLRHAAVVRSFSSLLHADANHAEAVNRISPALLAEAPDAERVWRHVVGMVKGARAIVAHGADFDRRFVPGEVSGATPWVCSLEDIAWPRPSSSRSLVAIALAHDLGVSHAHRAAVDVDLLARLFTRARELGADLDAMIARGLRPKALYQAMVSYDDRALASGAGFRWDGAAKTWTRKMAIEDAEALGFKVRRIET